VRRYGLARRLVAQELLNSREVTRIFPIHPPQHRCGTSWIVHKELRIVERSRRDRRQLNIVVPMAQFILQFLQRDEGCRRSSGTYVAQQLDWIPQSFGLHSKCM